MKRALAVAALAGLLFGAGGCSFSIGGAKTVSKDDVIKSISDKMTDAEGNKPETVTCPGDLDAKVGATLNCQMQVKGKPFEVNVTVTSVDGDQVKYDMVETVDKDQVAEEISSQLEAQVGRRPEKVTCPENLKGNQGATLRCELTDDGQTYGITVTVTSVEGGTVNFDFKVDDQPK